MSVLFTIVIPSFNRVATICATIDSVTRQSHEDCEIIVVDDGSSDGTVDIVRERFGDAVRVIRQANAGPGSARNRGAEIAIGRYLAFLDSDDLWFPYTLETYRVMINDYDAPAFVTSVPFPFYGEKPPNTTESAGRSFDCFEDFFATCTTYRNFGTCVLLVRKDVFDEAGGFTEIRMNGEDLDFALRIGDADGFVEVTSPPLVGWRQHSGNLTGDVRKTAEGLLRILAWERAGRYPGGNSRRKQRREIIARHCRSAALAAVAQRERALGWRIYRKTFAWHLLQRRWRFVAGLPFIALRNVASRRASDSVSRRDTTTDRLEVIG